jgi:hypothetical protein
MSTRQLLVLLASLASLTTSVVSGEARCPDNVATIRYHSLQNSQISISVTINRSGPFEFMVDTGSQITIIEPSLAAELNLAAMGRVGVTSDVRRAEGEMVRLDLIEAGSGSVEQSLAAVQSLAQIQAANPKIRGILGETFLAHFDVLMDYGHNILCFDATGQMQRDLQGERVPLVTKPDSEWDSPLPQPLLIPVQVGEKSRNRILRLDSGANVPQLYVNTLDSAPWVQRQNALRGQVTGKAAEYFALMPPQDIHIYKHVLRDAVFATPLKTSHNVDFKGEDGLLPTSLFKRIFISYTDHFVILDPR